MQKITQNASGGNEKLPPEIEPYNELMLRALLSALKYLPLEWSSGWLTLDAEGRRYLADEGIDGRGLETAVNDGVRAGLIMRKLCGGCACIALKERAVQR